MDELKKITEDIEKAIYAYLIYCESQKLDPDTFETELLDIILNGSHGRIALCR